MKKFLITNEDFSTFEPYSETFIQGVTVSCVRESEKLVFSINSMVPFAIYKFSKKNFFAISNDFGLLEELLISKGEKLVFSESNRSIFTSKPRVVRIQNCVNISSYTNWKQIEILNTGELVVKENKLPFQIPFDSEEGVNLLLEWFKKYRSLARELAFQRKFTPSLTGGLDTRILTYFWRDLPNLSNYYLRAIKRDGKNNVKKGLEEIAIAQQITSALNYPLERTEQLVSTATLSGIFTENARHFLLMNKPDFIYQFVAHHFSGGSLCYGNTSICPFLDDLYLQIKHPYANFMRITLALLCCPDLLDIRLYSFSNEPIYYFYDNRTIRGSVRLISLAKAFIAKWGLEEKVKFIKENY